MRKIKFFSVLIVLITAGLNTVAQIPSFPNNPWTTGYPPGVKLASGVNTEIAEDLPILEAPAGAIDFKLSLQRWNIWLPVPSYSQRDPQWNSQTMQTCGLTIGQAGCLLTSAAMVFRYYGSSKNPGQVNQCMNGYACPWYFGYGADYCSEGRASFSGIYRPYYTTFVWALSEGYPPILELTKEGSTHWVVIYAVSGDGSRDNDYYIIDPWDGYTKSLTSYTSYGWGKNRVAIYTPR